MINDVYTDRRLGTNQMIISMVRQTATNSKTFELCNEGDDYFLWLFLYLLVRTTAFYRCAMIAFHFFSCLSFFFLAIKYAVCRMKTVSFVFSFFAFVYFISCVDFDSGCKCIGNHQIACSCGVCVWIFQCIWERKKHLKKVHLSKGTMDTGCSTLTALITQYRTTTYWLNIYTEILFCYKAKPMVHLCASDLVKHTWTHVPPIGIHKYRFWMIAPHTCILRFACIGGECGGYVCVTLWYVALSESLSFISFLTFLLPLSWAVSAFISILQRRQSTSLFHLVCTQQRAWNNSSSLILVRCVVFLLLR